MFSNMDVHLSERKAKLLSDPGGWHNLFYKNIVRPLDESRFSVLFCENNGRPNAPVKVLVGMMILKEGNGWSDEQLFDQCRFNIKVMKALGLAHLKDDVPVESTYYEFRGRLAKYNEDHDRDLIKESFAQVTGRQLEYYNVSGQKIRMDSKLMQSNIRRQTRLELILEAVRKHLDNVDISKLTDLGEKDQELLKELKEKKPTNITYPLDNAQKKELLQRLGVIIARLLEDASQGCLLQRVFEEQYETTSTEAAPAEEKPSEGEDEGPPPSGPTPKPPKEISTSSVQSVHDPEAAYRSKGQGADRQQVAGYHANITETCDEADNLHLITNVQLEQANVSESDYLLTSIEETEQILPKQPGTGQSTGIEQVTTDGGYDSLLNRREMAADDKPHWDMHHHKGGDLRYQLEWDSEGQLKAWCTKTNQWCEVTYSQKANKYRIKHPQGSSRYFTIEETANYLQLLQHQASQQEGTSDKGLRANVESTIHQTFHRLLKRQKIKYRGMYKCSIYVHARAWWVNLKRIMKEEGEKAVILLIWLLLFPINHPMSKKMITGKMITG